jgi:mono/diheme cytochrome c family protein
MGKPVRSLILVALMVSPMQAFAAGSAQNGKLIAERWCASCHLVSPEQTRAASDVPSFDAIAKRSQQKLDWLSAFLTDPHPPMPDLSLTRQEISDLVAYFEVLQKH